MNLKWFETNITIRKTVIIKKQIDQAKDFLRKEVLGCNIKHITYV